MTKEYRGRIAPSPTGYLHLGHAMTFWRAQERARAAGGKLILRIEDVDLARCRPEFRDAIVEDLKWFGVEWDEEPFVQSERRQFYLEVWEKLREGGFIYPCRCSRKDVLSAGVAPHDENEEPIYPGTCRSLAGTIHEAETPAGINWRFRVPEGEEMFYVDLALGEQRAIAGKDFGDFVVWRKDDVPAYQLAVVADDVAMRISEVVRGEDLLLSTFRQLLIYRALSANAPTFFHAPLIVDKSGRRLAKRDAAMSLRALREAGAEPPKLRRRYLL